MADHIVDACCLINLYASGQFERIIAECGGDFYVTKQVQNESLIVRRPDAGDSLQLQSVPIDLSAPISAGLIHECALEGTKELQYYIQFASQLDDGEASCLAIAYSRGWMLATDDRKARTVAERFGVSIISTPELLNRWATLTSPTSDEISEVIRSIRRFAKFRPRPGSPMYDWWTAFGDSP